jgi:hypothetical protein
MGKNQASIKPNLRIKYYEKNSPTFDFFNLPTAIVMDYSGPKYSA